jgi:hypothetical protein
MLALTSLAPSLPLEDLQSPQRSLVRRPAARNETRRHLRRPCHDINDACVVVLLTTAVQRTFRHSAGMSDTAVRREWYQKSLARWHSDGEWRHAVVVVEGSGFDEWNDDYPHLEFITFVRTDALERAFCNNVVASPKHQFTSGQHELVSIGYAFRHSTRINAAATTHVLKLTGRYYVPAMAVHLHAANLTRASSSIRQAAGTSDMPGQMPCEAFGCRLRTRLRREQNRTVCDLTFACPYYKVQCEAQMKYRMRRKELMEPHQATLPRMPVVRTIRGTTNIPVDVL